MAATVYAFDVVLTQLRGIKVQGRVHATVQRFGSGAGAPRRMEAKTSEIDTKVTQSFPPVLFRVLVQDTIYDRIIVTLGACVRVRARARCARCVCAPARARRGARAGGGAARR